MFNKIFVLLFLFISIAADASQKAKVIVESTTVYQFPRSDSDPVGALNKDDWIVVSNFATEGYFKVRLNDGTIGWVTGNDLVTQRAINEEAKANGEFISDPLPEPEPFSKQKTGWRSNARILVGGGLQSLSLSPLNALYGVDKDTLGYNAGAEFQFAVFKYFHWAIRGEYLFSSAGPLTLSSGAKRTVTFRSIPLSLGLVFSFPDWKWFRLSIAGYGGIAVGTLLQVQDKTDSQVGTLSYNSYDPFGALAVQGSVGISSTIGIFGEASYRYQTAAQKASPSFGIAPVTINYGGVVMRGGIEFRFH